MLKEGLCQTKIGGFNPKISEPSLGSLEAMKDIG